MTRKAFNGREKSRSLRRGHRRKLSTTFLTVRQTFTMTADLRQYAMKRGGSRYIQRLIIQDRSREHIEGALNADEATIGVIHMTKDQLKKIYPPSRKRSKKVTDQ